MRNSVLLILLLCVAFCRGQHVVMLPTGFAPVDVSVIDAANLALSTASQSSDFDIKMAFMTSLSGVNGRYEVYKQLQPDYMEFFRTPNGSGFTNNGADLAAEHDRLARKAIDTLEVGSVKSVTIIYTTVINLTSSGISHDSKKTVYYSNDFSDCDKRRFEQIEDFTGKPVDFCVTSAEADNNAYVAWYSARLAEATGNDYIVTGALSVQTKEYCEPDLIFINDPHNGEITTVSDFHPPIRLMVNPLMDVGSITWSSPGYSGQLFTSNSGEFNTLNFERLSFEQINEVVVSWGDGQTSSVSILPVNFQVVVDEDTLEQQSNAIGEITYEYKNNHANFPVRDDIVIELIGPTNVEGAPGEETILPTPGGTFFKWTPNEEECDPYNFDHNLLANSRGLTEESVTTGFKLKCAFEIEDFIVSVPYTMDTKAFGGASPPTQRQASANAGESLYIVSNHLDNLEDLKRDVEAKIIWEGMRIPEEDDYWIQNPKMSTTYEPHWQGSPNYNYQSIYGFAQKDEFSIEHQPVSFHSPPTHGALIPVPTSTVNATAVFDELFLPLNTKLGKAEVTVFDQNKYVGLHFLHREERRIDGEDIAPQDLVDIKDLVNSANEFLSALDEWTMGIIPSGISGSADLKTIVYNQENPASNLFHHNVNSTITGGVSIAIPTSGDYWMVPGLSFPIPFVGGAGLGFKCTIGLAANFDWVVKKQHGEVLTGNFQDLPIEKKFSGLVPTFSGQGGLVVDVDVPGDFVDIEGGAVAQANIEFDPIDWARNPVTNKMEVRISGDFMPMQFVGYFEASIDVFGYSWNPFDEDDTSVDILDPWPENPYPFEWTLTIP